MAFLDFLSNEAGQRRRASLNEFMQDNVVHYIPPELRNAVGFAAEMNPVQGMGDAMAASGVVFDPEQTAEARRRAAVDMGVEMAYALTPAALASRGYMKPAQAVMEGLLGGSPAQEQIAQSARNLASDVQYAGRSVMQGEPRGLLDAFRPSGQAQSLSAATPKSGPTFEEAPMIVHHNLRPETLQMYSETGGMPMPSIAISNANFPLERFGDISLVMKPEKIKPSASMPVFPTDAFTGRAPRVEIEEGQRVLYPEDPYTPSGNRRKPKPYSVEEAFRRMKKNRAYEAGSEQHAGSGQIRAVLSDKFNNMSDIKKNRGLLVPDDNDFEDVKGAWNNLVWDSVNDLANQHFGGRFRVAEDYMTDLVMGRNTSWANASPEARDATRSVISNLRQEVQGMPTEYFEAKPKKILQVSDFDAAAVPEGNQEALEILRRAGVSDIRTYDEQSGQTRADVIRQFKDLMFAVPVGGLLGYNMLPQQQASPNDQGLLY